MLEQPVGDCSVNTDVVGDLLDRQPVGSGRGDQLQRRQTLASVCEPGAPFGAAVPLASLTDAAMALPSLTSLDIQHSRVML